MDLILIAAFIVGYGFGSIPFGLILTKLAGLGDIRKIGSGNIGATNVLRTGNKWLAAATLLADAGKGAAAVLIVGYFIPDQPFAPLIAGFGAFIGHLFPIWLRFIGGKGVAVYIGILFGLDPTIGFMFCGIWVFFAFALRFSSLAALTAAAAVPYLSFMFSSIPLFIVTLVMTVLLFFKHLENIKRLGAGTEPKIGAGKESE